ncbi:MAG: hypothetical protein ACRDY2_09735 [Acidimicrobiales bacterium]
MPAISFLADQLRGIEGPCGSKTRLRPGYGISDGVWITLDQLSADVGGLPVEVF